MSAGHLVYLRPCPAAEHLVTAYIYILRVFTSEQKLGDNNSCIRTEASWLVYHLEVCLGTGANEQREFLTFRDTFCFHLPCFSCVTNTATIILLDNTNTVRYFSLRYLFCDFYEGLDGKGGRGYKCQLSLKMSAIYQFSVRFQAICRLSVI